MRPVSVHVEDAKTAKSAKETLFGSLFVLLALLIFFA